MARRVLTLMLTLFACALLGCGPDQGLGSSDPFGDSSEAVNAGIPGQIAGGAMHACALAAPSGTVKCWGDNTSGQLGDGSLQQRLNPVVVSGISNAVYVATGSHHTCAVLANGTVQCWGDNTYGQLGNGSTANAAFPVTVPNLNGVTAIVAGEEHTCAVLANGTVQCWGYNVYGQLGDGTTVTRLLPTVVSGLGLNAVQLGVGLAHTCAVLANGTMKCWGYNADGEVGDSTTVNRLSPVPVSGLTNVVGAMVGLGFHSCAWLNDTTARCWGRNLMGALGDGTNTNRSAPVAVLASMQGIPLTGIAMLAGGKYYTVANMADQSVAMVGSNQIWEQGNFGINPLPPPSSPGETQVATATGKQVWIFTQNMAFPPGTATSVAAGDSHGHALFVGGTAEGWGANSYGQIGDGTTALARQVPVPVNNLP